MIFESLIIQQSIQGKQSKIASRKVDPFWHVHFKQPLYKLLFEILKKNGHIN
jgi:hypothetical protein